MKTFCIVGFVVAVAFLAQPGHGHHGRGGHFVMMKNCIDKDKFRDFASQGENCQDLKTTEAGQPTDRHWGGNKQMHAMMCFMDAANAYDKATNTTIVAPFKAGLKAVAVEGKGDALAAAFDTCNLDKATNLDFKAGWKVFACFLKESKEICNPPTAPPPTA